MIKATIGCLLLASAAMLPLAAPVAAETLDQRAARIAPEASFVNIADLLGRWRVAGVALRPGAV